MPSRTVKQIGLIPLFIGAVVLVGWVFHIESLESVLPGLVTMKLNAAAEMLPVTWPELGQIHPFAPDTQTAGYRQLIDELESWLATITGFDAVSVEGLQRWRASKTSGDLLRQHGLLERGHRIFRSGDLA